MKQWVRNRVIEINQLTNRENWFHIETADIRTRKGVKIKDISENSLWINGQNWAKKCVKEIKLSYEDMKLHNNESLVTNDVWVSKQLAVEYRESYLAKGNGVLNNVGERYKLSH